jgi:hypothetical protein
VKGGESRLQLPLVLDHRKRCEQPTLLIGA